MEFKPKKNQVYALIFAVILILILGLFFINKYNRSNTLRIIEISTFISVIIFSLIRFMYDLKAVICVDKEFLHYKRAGQNIKVRWEDIGRIEYSNRLKFIKALDCMVIYTGSGLLYIDYTIENYLQLWQFIISNYQQLASEPNIDDQLILILKKRIL